MRLLVNASSTRIVVFEDSVSVQVAVVGLSPFVRVCGNVLPVVLVYVQATGGGASGWRLIGSFKACSSEQIRLSSVFRSVSGGLLFRLEVDAFSDIGSSSRGRRTLPSPPQPLPSAAGDWGHLSHQSAPRFHHCYCHQRVYFPLLRDRLRDQGADHLQRLRHQEGV